MKFCFNLLLVVVGLTCFSQPADSLFAVRGLCLAAPESDDLDRFIEFMEHELAANNFNTLILRVDYRYEYTSYPQLRGKNALNKGEVKKLVKTAKAHKINLIPQVNLLGHQSWASEINLLLKHFPEFDETPHITMPEEYAWPNEDGLYCKSYCPLHPEVHQVVFAMVDEVMEVFEATDFHAGMDEVFYLGDDKCPRCAGKDKARLFADEVSKIRDHLHLKNQKLWIWGDRLLDGTTTGLGMWEASENDTHSSVDLIPKDVVICDWHYENAEPTAAYFALKGFSVVSCPWNKPKVALDQIDLMQDFIKMSNSNIEQRYLGVVQTVWTSAKNFLDLYYGIKEDEKGMGQVDSFKAMAQRFNSH